MVYKRLGIKWGNFVLVYERRVEKTPKPVLQTKAKTKKLAKGGINVYA